MEIGQANKLTSAGQTEIGSADGSTVRTMDMYDENWPPWLTEWCWPGRSVLTWCLGNFDKMVYVKRTDVICDGWKDLWKDGMRNQLLSSYAHDLCTKYGQDKNMTASAPKFCQSHENCLPLEISKNTISIPIVLFLVVMTTSLKMAS